MYKKKPQQIFLVALIDFLIYVINTLLFETKTKFKLNHTSYLENKDKEDLNPIFTTGMYLNFMNSRVLNSKIKCFHSLALGVKITL